MQQVAIVTGGATGIGRAIALRLAVEGIAVVVADRDAQGGQAVVQEIRATAGRAEFIQTDVTDERDRAIPPPRRLIQPEAVADLVMLFVRDETLTGCVIVWPNDEDWRFSGGEHIR